MLKHRLSALTQSSSRREGLGIHWPECHKATSHLAMGALSGPGAATPRAPTHTDGGFSGTPGQIHQKPGLLWGLVQEAYRIFYTLHQMFTFELPASLLDSSTGFLYKNGHGSGAGRGKGTHILLRGIYAVPFIHRNTDRAFLRLSGAGWGWDI